MILIENLLTSTVGWWADKA